MGWSEAGPTGTAACSTLQKRQPILRSMCWNAPFFSAGLRAFHQAVEDMIAARERDLERQETSTENDVLMLLIRARDPGTGRKLTRQEIRANVITFMAAGHESTANAITWTLYLLSRSPEWRECVRAERYKSVPKRRHCFSIG